MAGRYHKGKRNYSRQAPCQAPKQEAVTPAPKPEPEAVRSDKMRAVMEAAARMNEDQQTGHKQGFVPKPKAIRRYEKYTRM